MKSKFENTLTEIIDQHHEYVDAEFIWSGVEKQIDQKRKRKFIFILFSGISAVLLLTIFVLYTYSKPIQNDLNQPLNLKDKHQASINYNYNSENNNNNTQNNPLTYQEEPHTEKDFKTHTNTIQKYLLPYQKKPYATKELPLIKKGHHEDLFTDSSPANKQNETIAISKDARIYYQTNSLILHAGFSNITIENAQTNDLLHGNRLVLNKTYQKLKNEIKQNHKEIIFYLNTSMGIKKYYSNVLQEERATKEKIDLGILYPIYSKNRFNISSGIQYTRITDEFSWEGSYIENQLIHGINEIVYFRNEDIMHNSGLLEIEKNINRKILSYPVRYRLSIPLSFQYNLPITKYSFALYANYLFSYQFNSKFYAINSQGIPIQSREKGSWLNPNFELGISYLIPMKNNHSISISPNFQYTSYDHTLDNYKILHRNYHIGIKLGYQL